MLVNYRPSQQSCREEYKQWKLGATARYYTSHAKTMLPMRKSVLTSSRLSDHTKTWRLWRDANCRGMVMSPVYQVLPKPSCKAQWKGEEDKQTEEEVGRQHQRMDSPGVHQVPEGSGEEGKMEETGCEIICGAPATLAVKGHLGSKSPSLCQALEGSSTWTVSVSLHFWVTCMQAFGVCSSEKSGVCEDSSQTVSRQFPHPRLAETSFHLK